MAVLCHGHPTGGDTGGANVETPKVAQDFRWGLKLNGVDDRDRPGHDGGRRVITHLGGPVESIHRHRYDS